MYNTRPNGSDNDLVTPDGLKQEKRRLNHDLPTAGHQGIDRIKARIKQKFFFLLFSGIAWGKMYHCMLQTAQTTTRPRKQPCMEQYECTKTRLALLWR